MGMGTNQFDLLVDVDNDDPSLLFAAAEKKAAASPKPAATAPAPQVKLPTKPLPPAQAVRESRNYPGRGRSGSRGDRTSSRREFGDGGGGFGHGPRQPYRGGGRHDGYTGGDESGRAPHLSYEHHSGTGRGHVMKREGASHGNWGIVTDEAVAQETVEAVHTEGAPIVSGNGNEQEDVPQFEVEKNKEGEQKVEEEKEPEDKEMTLEEYEKVMEDKKKALLALKAEERKVEMDKDLQSMQQLSVKKDSDEVFIKLGSEKEKKKENVGRDDRAKKSLSINEFLKPADGERYPGGRGRGHGRGRGRGDRGGYQGGYSSRGPVVVPSIEDQVQFPTLGGK